jgi:hypothetical protein
MVDQVASSIEGLREEHECACELQNEKDFFFISLLSLALHAIRIASLIITYLDVISFTT